MLIENIRSLLRLFSITEIIRGLDALSASTSGPALSHQVFMVTYRVSWLAVGRPTGYRLLPAYPGLPCGQAWVTHQDGQKFELGGRVVCHAYHSRVPFVKNLG